MSDLVYVDLYQTPARKRLLGRRPQRWRFKAIAANNRVLAVSSEAYTNKDDALDAVDELFNNYSDVWLRQPGEANMILRLARDADA